MKAFLRGIAVVCALIGVAGLVCTVFLGVVKEWPGAFKRAPELAKEASSAPPSGPCRQGEFNIDCLAGTDVGCPGGSHVYMCLDGKWTLQASNSGKPGTGDFTLQVPVPMVVLPPQPKAAPTPAPQDNEHV